MNEQLSVGNLLSSNIYAKGTGGSGASFAAKDTNLKQRHFKKFSVDLVAPPQLKQKLTVENNNTNNLRSYRNNHQQRERDVQLDGLTPVRS